MTQEEMDLIDEAKNGSQAAFSKLFVMHKDTIFNTLQFIVHNRELANDLLSTTFLKAYEKLDTYTEHISFEMWLKTIAIHKAIDFIRANKYANSTDYVDDDNNYIQITAKSQTPEEELINTDYLKLVMQALPTLRKKHRDLIECAMKNMSYKEMSDLFGISIDAVKSSLAKARRILRKRVEKLDFNNLKQ